MTDTYVYVIVMRPDPLLWLVGFRGSLPYRVCTARVLSGGTEVRVDDSEIARAFGREPAGHVEVPMTALYRSREAAVLAAVDTLVAFVRGGFDRLMDLGDVTTALRRRFNAVVGGEPLPVDVARAAREAGLA